jgi:hypothetical protein
MRSGRHNALLEFSYSVHSCRAHAGSPGPLILITVIKNSAVERGPQAARTAQRRSRRRAEAGSSHTNAIALKHVMVRKQQVAKR